MKQYKPKKAKTKRRFELNKRETSTKRGYDKHWSKYRFRFLHYNPKCYCCGEKANVVDHIVAAKVDRDKFFWNETNYMPLCKKCHDTITGKFDKFEIPKTEEKVTWIKEQREKNNVSVRIKVVPLKK